MSELKRPLLKCRTESPSRGQLFWRGAELTLLFFVAPLLAHILSIRRLIIPAVLLLTVYCFLCLWNDSSFNRSRLWRAQILPSELKRILFQSSIIAAAAAAIARTLKPQLLFHVIREQPLLWGVVVLLYSLISVYPQELIYRTFFFHRYQCFFRNRIAMIAASAVVFSLAHIVYGNLIASLFSLVGGILFATTYDRAQSTFAVAFEHALYGCVLFTIGYGRYFFHTLLQ